MKTEQFIGYFENPGKLDASSIVALDEVIREYPFCQPAQLMYLKGLHNDENIRFNRQLKIAAAYAADRKILFDLLNTPANLDGSENQRTEVEPQKPAPAVVDENPVIPSEVPEIAGEETRIGHLVSITEMDLLPFDFQDFSGESPEEIPAINKAGRIPANDLIDRFIGTQQNRVLRPDHAPVHDLDVSLGSLKEDDEFLTETLARIYVQQGYYLKAIQAYEKLSLKIPEKSVYFASQIEMVRELIKNQ